MIQNNVGTVIKDMTLVCNDKNGKVVTTRQLRANPLKPDDPDVVIFSKKNSDTGEEEEATMPLSRFNKIHSNIGRNIKATLLAMLGTILSSNAYESYYGRPDDMFLDNRSKTEILADAQRNVSFSEDVDQSLPQLGSQGVRFVKSLSDHKRNLMHDLELTSEEYDNLADVAVRLARNETKNGTDPRYLGYLLLENDPEGSYIVSKTRERFSSDKDPDLSRGLTRLKIAKSSEKEKALFDKYGITYDNISTNIKYPEKSAIATIIHLKTLQEDYQVYLQSLEKIRPNLDDPEVKKSIANAESILFDNTMRPKAIAALRSLNGTDSEIKALQEANLTKSDLDDLRIYSRCITLSPNAYLAGRWRGVSLIPDPKSDSQDLASINVLHAVSGVGYISQVSNNSICPGRDI